jgi:hypothetical protein
MKRGRGRNLVRNRSFDRCEKEKGRKPGVTEAGCEPASEDCWEIVKPRPKNGGEQGTG